MRWAVVRYDGQVRACVPETAAVFILIDAAANLVPALMPNAGTAIPLAGRPGIVMSWEDQPVPLHGQPEFGKATSSIIPAGAVGNRGMSPFPGGN